MYCISGESASHTETQEPSAALRTGRDTAESSTGTRRREESEARAQAIKMRFASDECVDTLPLERPFLGAYTWFALSEKTPRVPSVPARVSWVDLWQQPFLVATARPPRNQ